MVIFRKGERIRPPPKKPDLQRDCSGAGRCDKLPLKLRVPDHTALPIVSEEVEKRLLFYGKEAPFPEPLHQDRTIVSLDSGEVFLATALHVEGHAPESESADACAGFRPRNGHGVELYTCRGRGKSFG